MSICNVQPYNSYIRLSGPCLFQSMPDYRQMLPTARSLFHTTFLYRVVYKFVVMYQMDFQSLRETKLKKSLPSTLKRAIGRKSDSLFSEGLLTLGMYIS